MADDRLPSLPQRIAARRAARRRRRALKRGALFGCFVTGLVAAAFAAGQDGPPPLPLASVPVDTATTTTETTPADTTATTPTDPAPVPADPATTPDQTTPATPPADTTPADTTATTPADTTPPVPTTPTPTTPVVETTTTTTTPPAPSPAPAPAPAPATPVESAPPAADTPAPGPSAAMPVIAVDTLRPRHTRPAAHHRGPRPAAHRAPAWPHPAAAARGTASAPATAAAPAAPDTAPVVAPTAQALAFASVAGLDPSPLATQDISAFPGPDVLLPIYEAASEQYHVPWTVLASINEIETDFGRHVAVSSAGAVGWMQFMPSTWARWGVDADGDGVADPSDPVDAIFSAAAYLSAAGAPKDIPRAVFAYNHAGWYVQRVLGRAAAFGAIDPTTITAAAVRGLHNVDALRGTRAGNGYMALDAPLDSIGRRLLAGGPWARQRLEAGFGQGVATQLSGTAGIEQIAGGGALVPIPGQPGMLVDQRILADAEYLIRTYHLTVTAAYATTGHEPDGEHPLGLALDLVPGPGGSWDDVDRLAAWAEPEQNHPRLPFRWVGYNGDPNHGRGNHLHLSWNHAPTAPGVRPVAWVHVFHVEPGL